MTSAGTEPSSVGPAMSEHRPGDDRVAVSAATLGFGLALGIGAVTLPLLALAAGYELAVIGLLTASSAISQLGVRLILPRVLSRYPDRALITLACLMIAASYGILLQTTALPVFLIAQLLQGAARGLFWTGSQTHVIRGPGGAVKSLAQNQILANLGTMSGPAIAGVLAALSLSFAVQAGMVTGVAALVASLALHRLPPFERQPEGRPRRLWREPAVLAGCLANATAGGWRSMLGSYIPVILSKAAVGPGVVGILVALADAASVGAAALLASYDPKHRQHALRFGVLAIATGLAILPFVAGEPIVAAFVLALAGAGSGMVVVLGPALVIEAVEPAARGEAIALSGTLRAVALLGAPATVALSLSFIPLAWAIVAVSLATAAPALLVGRRKSPVRVGRKSAS